MGSVDELRSDSQLSDDPRSWQRTHGKSALMRMGTYSFNILGSGARAPLKSGEAHRRVSALFRNEELPSADSTPSSSLSIFRDIFDSPMSISTYLVLDTTRGTTAGNVR